jgi:hypothetical protein
MSLAALLISLVALAFSAFTFWWHNWRPGKLHVGTPQTYAGHTSTNKLLLEFPFVFFNKGAKTVVVDNLRVRLPEENAGPLTFIATVERLGTDDGRAFATPFFVGAGQAIRMICEFQRNPGGSRLTAGQHTVRLEGRFSGRMRWVPIHAFPLNVTEDALAVLSHALVVRENRQEP